MAKIASGHNRWDICMKVAWEEWGGTRGLNELDLLMMAELQKTDLTAITQDVHRTFRTIGSKGNRKWNIEKSNTSKTLHLCATYLAV